MDLQLLRFPLRQLGLRSTSIGVILCTSEVSFHENLMDYKTFTFPSTLYAWGEARAPIPPRRHGLGPGADQDLVRGCCAAAPCCCAGPGCRAVVGAGG